MRGLNKQIEFLERRLKHAKRRLQEYQDQVDKVLKSNKSNNPSDYFTYHGGWNIGYWRGRVSVLEDIIDHLKESNEK